MVPALPVRGGICPSVGTADHWYRVVDVNRRYPVPRTGSDGAGFPVEGISTRLQRYGAPRGWASPWRIWFLLGPFSGSSSRCCRWCGASWSLLNEMPGMLEQGQQLVSVLPDRYPQFVSAAADSMTLRGAAPRSNSRPLGQAVLTSLAGLHSRPLDRTGLHDPDSAAGVFLPQGQAADAGLVWQASCRGAALAAAHLERK